jgi:alpha-mannosidase/mannosylglycerate hydrolase
MKKATMHIISHTHWDREWYQEFQGYRQRLVYQMDSLLDLLEKRPEYKYFHLDGQTSVILDYLEIRPENRNRLAGYIKDGRIIIGPWFVMPDELLLSGESLVRNLMLGHRICRQYGV